MNLIYTPIHFSLLMPFKCFLSIFFRLHTKSPHEVLKVKPNASNEEIKTAFKELSKQVGST